jgi:pimeloyl-ACP methyl ester carboxylesterase
LQQQLRYNNAIINYTQWGKGKELLFAFHGFDEDAETYALLATTLGNTHTVIAIDMPYHGGTNWNGKLVFWPNELHQIIQLILKKHGYESATKYQLIGYSMGGRVALAYFEQYPQYVSKIILLASDGLHNSRWYWLVTQTKWGNQLFKYTMHHPAWLLNGLSIFGKVNVVSKGLSKIVHYYLANKDMRLHLYLRWTTMRKFKPNLQRIKTLLTKHQVKATLLFGKYDKIIVAKSGLQFQKNNTAQIQVSIIEAGHQLLQAKHIATISNMINS